MDRFAFIANFVKGATRTKEQREPVLGMQVVKLRDGWSYTFGGVVMTPPLSPRGLYERILRNDLNFYVRQAEDFRADVLTESPAMAPGTVSARSSWCGPCPSTWT
jgi:hypothetical protein